MTRRPGLVVLAIVGTLLSAFANAQDAERGRELYSLCARCHGAEGAGNALYLAPSIAGQGRWYLEKQLHNFKDGVRARHFDDIGGMRMRPMAKWLKTDSDVSSVAIYVASLPLVRPEPILAGGDPARGAALYATCAGCHGQNGDGVEAVGGPSLSHTSDWYQLTQIRNFQRGIRGSDARDVGGAAMRGMSMLLADEQAIKDVLAHIATLPGPAASGGAE
jgi:cytochrome c oxidase subunit 2